MGLAEVFAAHGGVARPWVEHPEATQALARRQCDPLSPLTGGWGWSAAKPQFVDYWGTAR